MVVKTVYRTALVTMEPRAIRTEGNKIPERCVGVVPHDEDENARMLSNMIVGVNHARSYA